MQLSGKFECILKTNKQRDLVPFLYNMQYLVLISRIFFYRELRKYWGNIRHSINLKTGKLPTASDILEVGFGGERVNITSHVFRQ